MNNYRWRTFAPYALLTAITAVWLVAVLALPMSRLDVPYSFAGDVVDKLVQIKTVADTGWLFHNDRLGYPFGYDRLDFPRFDSFNYAIMGSIAALTGHAGFAMNLYFIGGFFLIGFTAFFSFEKLGLRRGPALVCALLYSFLPYHILRGEQHVTNGAYFLVPLAMLVLAWLAQGHLDTGAPGVRKRWLFALIVTVLMPLQTPYNGVFFALLCLVAGAIAMAQRPHWRTGLATLVLLLVTAGTFVAEQIPKILLEADVGKSAAVAERSPFESQYYALLLNQVLLPTADHPIAAVADAKRDFDRAMQLDAPGFNRNQYIGAAGVLGLIALLWALARSAGERSLARAGPDARLESTVRIFALLAIVTILIAITSGLGGFIAYWITAKIRAYNRILPFLAFPCLFGAGWVLQSGLRRIRRNGLRHVALAGLGLCALLEITVSPQFGDRAKVVADYDRDRAYFEGVEQRLGEGAALFQLPVMWYPEHPPINRMFDYEEFKPYLLTRSLRVSYGGAQGRAGYAWGKVMEKLPPADAIAQAHRMGFAAILIDGNAYETENARQAAVDAFATRLPEPPSVSPDHRWWVLPLKGCCGAAVAQIAPGTEPPAFVYALDGGTALSFTNDGTGWLYNGGGWSDPESWGTWSRSPNAWLRLQIEPAVQEPLTLELQTRALVGAKIPARHLRVVCNGQTVAEVDYTLANPTRQFQFELPPGLLGTDGLLDIRFIVTPVASPQTAGINNDPRFLGIGLTELSIARAKPVQPTD